VTQAADLILAAQQRCDRVNASTITPQEWLSYFNSTAGQLYALLTSTYDDYNVTRFIFTLAGGDPGNSITVGANTSDKTVNNFDKLRGLWRQVSAAGGQVLWSPVMRVNSYMESAMYSTPALNPVLGNLLVTYQLIGNVLEVLPSQSCAGQYRLAYVPCFTKLVTTDQTIDGTWMSTNGIEEFIVLGMAWKALVKEESIESANVIRQEQEMLAQTIMKQFATRDDSQPGRIVDVKRVRDNWGMGGGWGEGIGPY
jgi:hypothetical protein